MESREEWGHGSVQGRRARLARLARGETPRMERASEAPSTLLAIFIRMPAAPRPAIAAIMTGAIPRGSTCSGRRLNEAPELPGIV